MVRIAETEAEERSPGGWEFVFDRDGVSVRGADTVLEVDSGAMPRNC